MKTKLSAGGLKASLAIIVFLLLAATVVPVSAAPALDGEGTMTVDPVNVTYGTAGNTFTFTFTANIGDFGPGSQVALTIPAGWTTPTTAAGAGHVSVNSGTCTLVPDPLGITGTKIFVDMSSCTTGQSFTITYAGVTIPSPVNSPYMFLTQTDIGPGGNGLINITAGSPTITVDPAHLTVSAAGLTPQNKVYDGNDNADIIVGSPSLVGVLGTDVVSLDTTAAFGLFSDRNVGTGKTVTIEGLTLTGSSATNYILDPVTRTGSITSKPVSVSAVTDTKIYDGTASSSVTPTTDVALASGDVANFTQVFNNRNVGTAKTLTPSGTVDDGNGGLNYSYTFYPITTGTITARAITVTAVTDSKEYDGTANSTGVPSLAVGSTLGAGDTATWTQTFDTKNVGTNKILTPAGKVSDGNGGLNYSYTYNTVTTGVITAKPIDVTAAAKSKTYGVADPALTYSVTPALITGDSLSGSLTRDPGNDVGNYAIKRGTLDNTNYAITFSGANLTINKATLMVTAENQTINTGDVDPFFSFTYSGFMYSDNSSMLDVEPTCGVSASHSLPGKYPIVCSGGSDNNYDFSFVNGTLTVTAIPTLLTPGVDEHLLTNTLVTFDWVEIPTATSYTLQIASNNTFTTLLVNKVIAAPTSDSQVTVQANKTLYWRVRSFGPYGTSAWADYRSFVTANPPSIPALLAPAQNGLVTTYSPTLDWSTSTWPAPTSFGRYRVQIATDAVFSTGLQEYTTNETFATDSFIVPTPDLDPNTKYYWRVRSENSLNQYSAWSTVRYFRTALLPVTLNALPNSDHPVTLRPTFDWSDPNVNAPLATSYTIQIASTSTFTSIVHTGTAGTASYTPAVDLPVVPLLYWRVAANGANGPSLWSPYRSFTPPTPPSVSSLLLPANNLLVASYTPTLKWSEAKVISPATFDHYQVQVDDDPLFGTPFVDDDTLTLSTQVELTTPPLAHNTKFYWRVLAFDSNGQYSISAVRSLRTKVDPPTLTAPVDASLELRPLFTWDAPSGQGAITGYTIQISKNNTFTQIVHTGNPALPAYIPTVDLPKGVGVTLYWRVLTKGLNGPSVYSAYRSFTMPVAPPLQTALLLPAANALVTTTTPTFTWKPVLNAQNYIIQVDDSQSFDNPEINNSSPITPTFTPGAGLLATNTRYYWRVRAVNSAGELGNWSVVRMFRSAILPPTLVAPTDNATDVVRMPLLDWSDVLNNAGYTLQVWKAGTTPVLVKTVTLTTNVSQYQFITNLLPNTSYFWKVQTKAANGPSLWSQQFYFTTGQ